MAKESIAAQIFQQYGLGMETAVRAGGWTNAVWLNQGLALRLSPTKNSDRIRREIQLARMLPAVVGYPPNLSSGVVEDHEWSISKRIEAVNWNAAWPGLSWVERTHAMQQIWRMAQAVHSVEVDQVVELAAKRPWYSSLDPHEIFPRFRQYGDQGIFTPGQAAALTGRLAAFFDRLPGAPRVLNHGDITADNILWKDGEVVSLLDFEHALTAPAEMDLNSFINLAFFDDEGRAFGDDTPGFRRYQSAVKELIRPLLREPESIDLLFGFAILYQQRFLDSWIEEPCGPLGELEPYQKLVSLADPQRSYLHQITA